MPLAGFSGLFLPSILITIALLGLAGVVDRRSSFYKKHVDLEVSAKRFHSIDGLRGFLAIAVLYHHAVISYFFYRTGQWVVPPSRVATLFGQGGVAMFFMITALLFWSRALEAEGQINLNRFFWSRITRMVPMYFVASGALVLTALAFSHFRLVVSLSQVAKESAAWLLFMFPGGRLINGFVYTGLINTVFWSLVYEWKFYFLFPILSFFARGWQNWLLIAFSALMAHWYSEAHVEWYFVYGTMAATLLHSFPSCKKLLGGPIASLVVVALLAWIYKSTSTAYDPKYQPLFFGIFLIIAGGNTMFGLLTSRRARILGAISYSFYLLHNFVLYLSFRLVNHFTEVAQLSVTTYWLITAVIGAVTVGLSLLTYKYIEFPFLRWKQPSGRLAK